MPHRSPSTFLEAMHSAAATSSTWSSPKRGPRPALQTGYPDGEVGTGGAGDGDWQESLARRAAAARTSREPTASGTAGDHAFGNRAHASHAVTRPASCDDIAHVAALHSQQ